MNGDDHNQNIEQENLEIKDRGFREDLATEIAKIDAKLDADYGKKWRKKDGQVHDADTKNREIERDLKIQDTKEKLAELIYGEDGKEAGLQRHETFEEQDLQARKPDLDAQEQKKKAEQIQKDQKGPEREAEQMKHEETEVKGNIEVKVQYEQTGQPQEDKAKYEGAKKTAREELEAQRKAIRERATKRQEGLKEKFQEKSQDRDSLER